MNQHPFGLVLQTLESAADRLRHHQRVQREQAQKWREYAQRTDLTPSERALVEAAQEMTERAKREPKPTRPIRLRQSIYDLDEADRMSGGNYPNYKWLE